MGFSILRLTIKRSTLFINEIHLRKSLQINHLLCNNFHNCQVLYKRRKTAEERKSTKIIEYSPKSKKLDSVIGIWKNMTVQEVATAMNKSLDHVFEVMNFVENAYYYNKPNSVIDNPKVIYEILKKSGFRYKIIPKPGTEVEEEKNEDITRQPPSDPKDLVRRYPVVTIMGHVDHGKTTLLDSLRHTSVVSTEFGGITQHIGAFSVKLKSGDKITFLDTPGHAAFSAMRARGAHATDIVVLVVAADDGVMEQTVESIRMAREANVPIIVAINKIDKPEADIERTKKLLMQHGVQTEDYGGEIQAIPISALKGINLDLLTEAIVLQAEIMDLKANPRGLVEGVIIESKTDPRRGKLSTSIIQRGTLRRGCILVAGLAWAKVRAMFDHDGKVINEAPPSTPVEILGWRELPFAGDEMLEVESEQRAHSVIKYRKNKKMEQKQQEDAMAIQKKTSEHLITYKAQLEQKRKLGKFRMKPTGPRSKEIQDDDLSAPRVNIIIKGDVHGSVEAILDVIETYDCQNQCHLDLVHYGVGDVTETDVELAESFNAIIYSFNVKCPEKVLNEIKEKKIPLKNHNIIYKLIDDLKEELSSKLPPKQEEEILGEANVLQQFIVTEGKKKIAIAGCRCIKGSLKKSALFRVVRDNEVIYEGTLESMRHLKNEVDTIKKDNECGLQFKDKTISFQPGDVIICYKLVDVPQIINWDPGF